MFRDHIQGVGHEGIDGVRNEQATNYQDEQ
jgi:hypothetical protein